MINELISTIVSFSGVSLRVLVAEAGAHGLHDSLGGEVLTGDQLEALELSLLFSGDDSGHIWIFLL